MTLRWSLKKRCAQSRVCQVTAISGADDFIMRERVSALGNNVILCAPPAGKWNPPEPREPRAYTSRAGFGDSRPNMRLKHRIHEPIFVPAILRDVRQCRLRLSVPELSGKVEGFRRGV